MYDTLLLGDYIRAALLQRPYDVGPDFEISSQSSRAQG